MSRYILVAALLVAGVVLATGCATAEPQQAPMSHPTLAPAPTPEGTLTLHQQRAELRAKREALDAYMEEVQAIVTKLTDSMRRFGGYAEGPYLTDDTLRQWMAAEVKFWGELADEWREMTPPRYPGVIRGFHAAMLDAFEDINRGGELIMEGMETTDIGLVVEGMDLIDVAIEHKMGEAADELAEATRSHYPR